MKKYIALLLALVTVFALTACGRKTTNDETRPNNQTTTTTAPTGTEKLPESALSLLETVWTSFGDDQKFYAMGGSYDEDETKNNNVENGPGKYALDHPGLTTTLMVPADKVSDIAEAASLMHGMMANNFTCGAYRLNSGVDANAFGKAMHTSITEQRFLCGAPDAIFVAVLGDYVVAAYGAKDLLDTLQAKMTAAYAGTQVLYNEMIPN